MAHDSRYRKIMRIYDERRAIKKAELEKRLEEIKKVAPAFFEMENEIASLSTKRAKALIVGDDALAKKFEDQRENLIEEKNALLVAAGFSKDYDKPEYFCDACKDSGFVDGNKCTCYKQLEAEELFDASNIKDVLEKENFETFNFDFFDKTKIDPASGLTAYEMIKKNYNVAKDMADNFVPGEKNLLLIGQVGTGKTFLSNCVAKAVLDKGYSVVYMSASGLFDKLANATFNKGGDDDREQILGCDLLIIDDLGTEFNNSFVSSQLFNCINERKLKKKSTIISTNLDLNQIRDSYSERVSSRLLESYSICKFFNLDIRLIKRRQNLSNG